MNAIEARASGLRNHRLLFLVKGKTDAKALATLQEWILVMAKREGYAAVALDLPEFSFAVHAISKSLPSTSEPPKTDLARKDEISLAAFKMFQALFDQLRDTSNRERFYPVESIDALLTEMLRVIMQMSPDHEELVQMFWGLTASYELGGRFLQFKKITQDTFGDIHPLLAFRLLSSITSQPIAHMHPIASASLARFFFTGLFKNHQCAGIVRMAEVAYPLLGADQSAFKIMTARSNQFGRRCWRLAGAT